MNRAFRVWSAFLATRLCGGLIDLVSLAAAYFAANLLRFDLQPPRWGWRTTALAFIVVGVVQLLALMLTGAYRLAWRRTGLRDLPRYLLSIVLASAVLTILRIFLPVDTYSHVRPPYSITLICAALSVFALTGWRIIWSWFWAARRSDLKLIARSARRMNDSVAKNFFAGKVVMVTGAGGSIGSEIVRQVVACGPKQVLLVERGENALYEIDRECPGQIPLMKDINDVAAMEAIFAEYHPEIVLHAAAYKHVPMVEANPEEGWRNNTEATKRLAELALKYEVRRFVLISTDKAVNPVSVMGKTKLAAERAIMSVQASPGTMHDARSTSFCAVRFGNVFGSSGSVVPLFREQIEKRRPLTVTHPEMKRYFMTIEEAVGLVLQAASRTEKAIYTLDMGEPIRILDLAEGMIRQAGYRPYVDIPIVFSGIRPGEKLFEELDVSEKSCYKTDMAKVYITKVNG